MWYASQEGSQGDAVGAWLQQHDLAEYREAFSRAGVGPDMLALLGDEELRQMGVLTLGPRRRILAAIQATQVARAISLCRSSRRGHYAGVAAHDA